MGRGISKSKNLFSELSSEFKDKIASATTEEINNEIAQVAKCEAENQETKKKDEDLAAKREAVGMAMEPYKELSKVNKQKIGFCMLVLSDRGQ
jgi:hypothetical protein